MKKIIQKNLTFVTVFGTRNGSNQVNLFVSHAKQIPFLSPIMSNNVKNCQLMVILRHVWSFLSHFYMFFALFNINK